MKFHIQIWVFLFLIIGCNTSVKEKKKVQKQYGDLNYINDSISVEIKLMSFQTWDDLIKRIDKIVCNDSIPKITLKSEKEIKTVYLFNPCWENYGCILTKSKNEIIIYDDTINKSYQNFYPLDSLENVLERDLKNNGKNPILSDSPNRLFISISYHEYNSKKIIQILDRLTTIYEVNAKNNEMKIIFQQIIPPPLAPKFDIIDESQFIE